MRLLDEPLAIQTINQYGRLRLPFVLVVDFEKQHSVVLPLSDIDTAELCFDFNGFTNAPAPDVMRQAIFFEKHPPTFADFLPKFDFVKAQLGLGNSFLTNLTTSTRLQTNLTLRAIFDLSQAKYKLWMKLPAGANLPQEIVCYSPEIFVQIQDGQMASFPMKGTIDAALPDAQERILADPKELAEHATIVDLIRNDLSMIADRVWVERFRYVDEIKTHDKTLLQVSSEVRATLPPNYLDHLGDLLFRLLPAGSVSGAPKPKTLDIIAQAEGEQRGYYTGIMGYFDGQRFDSGVLIRFVEQRAEGLFYRSGGGITFLSEAHKEYQELIDKVYVPLARND